MRIRQVFSKGQTNQEERGKVMVIAGHKVELVTRNSARIGCAEVTRADAEMLLAEMNNTPVTPPFLQSGPKYADYVAFCLSCLASSKEICLGGNFHGNGGFGDYHSVSLCLKNERAQELLKFLAQQLDYGVYKKSSIEKCSSNSQ
jgi:hypothetical protein